MLVFQKKSGTGTTPEADFSDVVLLLKMENNTDDSSSFDQTCSFSSNNSFTASEFKFGAYSADFGDAIDYIQCNGNATPGGAYVFGTGDFTVEAWVYPESIPGGGVNNDMMVFGKLTSTPPMFLFLRNSDLAPCLWNGTTQHTSTAGVAINEWSHVAWSRASGILKMFINGVQVFSGADTVNYTYAGTMFVGGHGQITGRIFDGFIDELRVIKGVGIYTGNFAAPTTEFPTS